MCRSVTLRDQSVYPGLACGDHLGGPSKPRYLWLGVLRDPDALSEMRWQPLKSEHGICPWCDSVTDAQVWFDTSVQGDWAFAILLCVDGYEPGVSRYRVSYSVVRTYKYTNNIERESPLVGGRISLDGAVRLMIAAAMVNQPA